MSPSVEAITGIVNAVFALPPAIDIVWRWLAHVARRLLPAYTPPSEVPEGIVVQPGPAPPPSWGTKRLMWIPHQTWHWHPHHDGNLLMQILGTWKRVHTTLGERIGGAPQCTGAVCARPRLSSWRTWVFRAPGHGYRYCAPVLITSSRIYRNRIKLITCPLAFLSLFRPMCGAHQLHILQWPFAKWAVSC